MYTLSNGCTTQYNMYNLYISANTIYTALLLADSCTTSYVQSKQYLQLYLCCTTQYLQPYLHIAYCICPSSTSHSCAARHNTYSLCIGKHNMYRMTVSLLQCLLVIHVTICFVSPLTSRYVFIVEHHNLHSYW